MRLRSLNRQIVTTAGVSAVIVLGLGALSLAATLQRSGVAKGATEAQLPASMALQSLQNALQVRSDGASMRMNSRLAGTDRADRALSLV